MNEKDPTLGDQLRSLALGVDALQAKSSRHGYMLDKTMDLHNELTDWACNSEHSEAADEVMRILDRYVTPARGKSEGILHEPAVVIPLALSRRH